MGEHSFLYLVGVLKIVSFNLKFSHENIKANKSGSLIKEVFHILHACLKGQSHELRMLGKSSSQRSCL